MVIAQATRIRMILRKTPLKVYSNLNHILTSGYFPRSWCEGVITSIFKSGDKQDPANYRGICINSCLGKLSLPSILIHHENNAFRKRNFCNAALCLRCSLPSILIHHENNAFRKRNFCNAALCLWCSLPLILIHHENNAF